MTDLPPPSSFPPGPPGFPDWGTVTPPAPAPVPLPSASGSGRGRQLLGAVAAAAVIIGATAWWFGREASPYPAEWDERVVDLVDFVEDERGHDFEHPVHLDFLTEEEYSERRRGDAGELTDEDRAEIERAEGLMRALGLAGDDLDLFESSNDLSDAGTLAFYDLDAERITVRGTEVTPRLAATLVHELTHALQDQVFSRIDSLLERGEDDDATSGELLALRGLVEGDADRIETAYVDGLPSDEREAIEASDEEGSDDLDDQDIPEALIALFAMPYALGEGFIAALEAEGAAAIDRAFFDELPTTEEHLLVPSAYLDGDQPHVVSVATPDDVEVLDEGDFGAASLMIVLGARLEATEALQAAVGWGGDAFITYEQDGRTCIDLAVSSDTDADALELFATLQAWVAAGPEGAATVEADDGDVLLHACDPGDGSGATSDRSPLDTLSLAAFRSRWVTETTAGGAPPEFADCYADAVLDAFTMEELTAAEPPPEMEARITAAATSCA